MGHFLDQRGYFVLKRSITETEIQKIRNELTVAPKESEYSESQPFKIYRENETYLVVPKAYGIKKFGKTKMIIETTPINVTFNKELTLRPAQKDAVNDCYEAFKKNSAGILQLGTGLGKTCCACYMISKLQGKSIVIVNTNTLKDQWTAEIHKFIPNARIGYIQQNKMDILDKDIIIAMIQSLCSKDYPSEILTNYKIVIIDEVVHLASTTFSQILFKVGGQYHLGLSATPERKDGLTKVLHYFLGDIAHKNKSLHANVMNIRIYKTKGLTTGKELFMRNGKPNRPKMITEITENSYRNKLIVDIVHEYSRNPDRNILLMTERREHAVYLNNVLSSKGVECGIYYGSMKFKDLEESKKKQVIIGTSKMTLEGFDCPKLNTLIFAAPPQGTLEQAVGRILRVSHTIPTEIVDIQDTFSTFRYSSKARETYYRSKGYSITYYTFSENGITEKKINDYFSYKEPVQIEFVESDSE